MSKSFRTCFKLRKAIYPTIKRAKMVAASQSKKTGTDLRVYKCDECRGYHLTHWQLPKQH